MSTRNRWVALAIVGAVLAAATASAVGASPAAKQKPRPTPSFHLRFGTILPFTGDLSSVGPSLDASARLAVDTINAALK